MDLRNATECLFKKKKKSFVAGAASLVIINCL